MRARSNTKLSISSKGSIKNVLKSETFQFLELFRGGMLLIQCHVLVVQVLALCIRYLAYLRLKRMFINCLLDAHLSMVQLFSRNMK